MRTIRSFRSAYCVYIANGTQWATGCEEVGQSEETSGERATAKITASREAEFLYT